MTDTGCSLAASAGIAWIYMVFRDRLQFSEPTDQSGANVSCPLALGRRASVNPHLTAGPIRGETRPMTGGRRGAWVVAVAVCLGLPATAAAEIGVQRIPMNDGITLEAKVLRPTA